MDQIGTEQISHWPILWDIDLKRAGESARLQEFRENTFGVRDTSSQGAVIDEIGVHNAFYDLYWEVQRLYDGKLKDCTINVYGYGQGIAESESSQSIIRGLTPGGY